MFGWATIGQNKAKIKALEDRIDNLENKLIQNLNFTSGIAEKFVKHGNALQSQIDILTKQILK